MSLRKSVVALTCAPDLNDPFRLFQRVTVTTCGTFFKVSVSCNYALCMRMQVFSLVTFICATVWHEFVPLGGGWVQFVSIMAFILTTFLYMLYVFRLTSKLSEQIPFKFTVSATNDTTYSTV